MDEKLIKLLRSVGVTTFIRYYDVFKQNRDCDSNEEIFSAFERGKETWQSNSMNTKASKGKSIFRDNRHIEVLQYIIENVNKIDQDTLEEAKRIYDRETLNL